MNRSSVRRKDDIIADDLHILRDDALQLLHLADRVANVRGAERGDLVGAGADAQIQRGVIGQLEEVEEGRSAIALAIEVEVELVNELEGVLHQGGEVGWQGGRLARERRDW